MYNVNKVIGKNLLILRKNKKLTQLELAEKFNYSDKTISKWETGESLPSIEILYELAKFYNVTLDDLTNEEFQVTKIVPATTKKVKNKMFPTHLMITLLAISAVWVLATILSVSFKLTLSKFYYMIFLWAIPLSCVVMIIFNSIWGKMYLLFPMLSALLWSTLLCLHLQLNFVENIWTVYLLGIPLQIAIILWGAMLKKPIKHKNKNEKTQPATEVALVEEKPVKEEKVESKKEQLKSVDEDDDLSTKLY